MISRRRAALAVAVAAAVIGGLAMATTVANAATGPICEQFGSTRQGEYIVMNNRWNPAATGQQCIDVTSNGFRITQQPNTVPTNGGPASYPAIYAGCHYTNCSDNLSSPRRIDTIGSIDSSISWTFVGNGNYNASYDIRMDPTPRRDGVNRTEIMIWFDKVGPIQPIGSATGETVTIGGRSWQVWSGNNGLNDVVSYVAPAAIPSWSFNTLDFIRDTIRRGVAREDWYLTSIQAGFEPWSGGVGLAVNSFSVRVNGGTPPTNPTTPPTTPPTTRPTTPPPTPPAGGCTASYRVVNQWSDGFQGEVTVRNDGSSAINGWTVAWSFSGGQSVTQSWNTTLSGSGGAYTARPVSYNATIGGGSSTTFGFIGSGSPGASPQPTCSAG